jgi:hypothetical protein
MQGSHGLYGPSRSSEPYGDDAGGGAAIVPDLSAARSAGPIAFACLTSRLKVSFA